MRKRQIDEFQLGEIIGVGIGLETDTDSGLLRIKRVFPESPAASAGLTAGMLIQSIDGKPVEGKSLNECLVMLGGVAGTPVAMELTESNRTRRVEVTRGKFLTFPE